MVEGRVSGFTQRKAFVENGPGGEQGGAVDPGQKTLMRARRPPDEGTLGAGEEESRIKCFGFWRIKKGFFFCVRVCLRSSKWPP